MITPNRIALAQEFAKKDTIGNFISSEKYNAFLCGWDAHENSVRESLALAVMALEKIVTYGTSYTNEWNVSKGALAKIREQGNWTGEKS